MKVLVTGATGFTGRHLALELKRRGYDVRGFVRRPEKARDLREAGIELATGDLTNAESVSRAMAGCAAVYHIAALYREAGWPDQKYWDVNVQGTRNILDAAESHSVKRVVHCSTVGVHGDVAVPANEKAPYAPGDIYQVTKLAGEKLARERFNNGLPGVIVRPAAIYGPGDTRFLKLFRTIQRGTFHMIGSGQVYYHLTYISDLVDGFIRCGENPNAVGKTYILAGKDYTTLNDLVGTVSGVLGKRLRWGKIPLAPVLAAAWLNEKLCRPFGIEPILHVRRVHFFVNSRGFSIDKASRELGYSPRTDLEAGIACTANWYRANGML